MWESSTRLPSLHHASVPTHRALMAADPDLKDVEWKESEKCKID